MINWVNASRSPRRARPTRSRSSFELLDGNIPNKFPTSVLGYTRRGITRRSVGMVDEGASKAPGRKSVWVRVPPPAVRFWDGLAARHSASISLLEARTELFPSAPVLLQ